MMNPLKRMKEDKRMRLTKQHRLILRDVISNEETLQVNFKTMKGDLLLIVIGIDIIPDFWNGVFNKTLANIQFVKAWYNGRSVPLPSLIFTDMILKEIIQVREEQTIGVRINESCDLIPTKSNTVKIFK